MAIDTMDKLVAALGTSKDQQLFFPSATNVSGGWVWLNYATISSFGQISIPAAAALGGTAYTQGALAGYPKWTANPAASTYIGRWGQTATLAGTVHLYDLLWGCSGFNGALTTAQAVTTPVALPARNVNGVGAEIWIFCTTATGPAASNITVQYTNSDGVAGRNTVSTAHIVSMPSFRMYQVPLQSGDTGVKSIQSVTLSASTQSAGSFGVLIMDRLAANSCALPSVGNVADFATLGMPIIDNTSVLAFIHQATTTSSGIIMGQLSVIQG